MKQRISFCQIDTQRPLTSNRESERLKTATTKGTTHANREKVLDQIGGNDSCHLDNNLDRRSAKHTAAGVAYGYYSLYNQHVLGSGTWTLISTNDVLDDTNFVVNPFPYYEGYYLVAASTNWNNSGIPNWDLADPNNPGLGKLTVSIVSPSQGQILQ
jgi:hypothetical protein